MPHRRMRNRIRRTRGQTLGNAALAVGLFLLLLPAMWSARSSILQSREAASRPIVLPRVLGAPLRVVEKPRIVIPKLGVDAVIVEEVTDADLDRGPMWLSDSGQPGRRGNCCIAAHKEKWFRGLPKLEAGDKVILRARGRSFIYSITGKRIMRATDLSALTPTKTATLTLITCSGPAYFGHGKGRVVVSGILQRAE